MEPEVLVPCLQELATGPYPESRESGPLCLITFCCQVIQTMKKMVA